MLSYIWYILYQLWYILHKSFDTWGYPWYIPCIWHLKIHIPCIWHAYLIDMTFHKKIIEHICVISIGYTRIKILILSIYLVYPTPTFCLQKWVEPGRWCRKSGLLRLVSVCLVSSVISWMPKQAAAHVRDLPMCVLAALPVTRITASDMRKGTCETYLAVCVIRRVKASTTERATRACQCMQWSPFVNKTAAFMPT